MSETKTYEDIETLKLHTKEYHIKVKVNKNVVILEPTKAYTKEYADGDMEKAVEDLAKWFGLIGTIDEEGKVVMTVKGDEE